jgi:P pilus assembly chaperone PapD
VRRKPNVQKLNVIKPLAQKLSATKLLARRKLNVQKRSAIKLLVRKKLIAQTLKAAAKRKLNAQRQNKAIGKRIRNKGAKTSLFFVITISHLRGHPTLEASVKKCSLWQNK